MSVFQSCHYFGGDGERGRRRKGSGGKTQDTDGCSYQFPEYEMKNAQVDP